MSYKVVVRRLSKKSEFVLDDFGCSGVLYIPILSITSSAFPTKTSKYENYRTIVFWICLDIQPSTHAQLDLVANQSGGILMYFDGHNNSRI